MERTDRLESLRVNPLRYRLLKTEREMSEETGFQIEHPICLFNLEGLEIDLQAMKAALAETYERLPWDNYLVKRDQVNFLAQHFPELQEFLLSDFLPRYFADQTQLNELQGQFDRLSEAQRARFDGIRPYRRRGISQFMLHKSAHDCFEWSIEDLPHTAYMQTSEVKHDYRSLQRTFPPSPPQVTENRQFREVLVHLAVMSDIARMGKAKRIKIICQQVGIVTDPHQVVSNAPEGIHQDGCDYIVSALVVEIRGIAKGASVVFGPDKQTEYLRHTLVDGEAIFQADTGSPLWHVVEPIEAIGGAGSTAGVRNIIGYDIYIEESA